VGLNQFGPNLVKVVIARLNLVPEPSDLGLESHGVVRGGEKAVTLFLKAREMLGVPDRNGLGEPGVLRLSRSVLYVRSFDVSESVDLRQ
jgi:hypothetical protein